MPILKFLSSVILTIELYLIFIKTQCDSCEEWFVGDHGVSVHKGHQKNKFKTNELFEILNLLRNSKN